MESDIIIRNALGDKYNILSVIGRGGMATVYKAIQQSLNRVVALKVIHQNLVHDDEFIGRFLREAQVCAQLTHPNIVIVYDYGSVGTVHYMSMEYLEGMTLREKIKAAGRLKPDETVRYISPIANAIGYIHQKGYVHRDVKSSNIMITNDGRPVLMDFGIVYSKFKETLSQSGSVLGTPEYMSPEQAEGKVQIDGRSDIYSLGVIMFECLTGRLPFKSINGLATLHQILHENAPSVKSLNPKVPEWFNSLVSDCLIKDRTKRISSGTILAAALLNKNPHAFNRRADNKFYDAEHTEHLVGKRISSSYTRRDHRISKKRSVKSELTERRVLIAIFVTMFLAIVMIFIMIFTSDII